MALNEKTVPKPLSGYEVVDAIIHGVKVSFRKQAPKVPHEIVDELASRLKTQMRRDCFLNNIISYSVYASETAIRVQFQSGSKENFEFQATSHVKFPATQSNIKETTITLNGRSGAIPGDGEIESVDVKAVDVPRAPNVVRVDTQQDIPAIVQSPQGKILEKRIKYAPKSPKVESVKGKTKATA